MKKSRLLTLILVFAGVFSAFSQSIFDKFENNDEVKTVKISQKMFEMFSKIQTNDAEAQEFMQITKKLTGLKIFTTTNPKVAQQMNSEVNSYLKKSSLQELMKIKDENSNVKFYVKEGKNSDIVSELLMFVEGSNDKNSDTVLLTLTGDIDLNEIGLLVKKMNLPEQINDVNKK